MNQPPRPRLFLVDGYALVYRAFHAVGNRPLTNSRGENTSIPWGIANFLERLRRSHAPTHLGWVHDAGMSERDVKFAAYKATRVPLEPQQRADFDRGIERVEQLLAAQKIPLLELAGYEADDVIATLARQSVARDIDVVIVSPDKDLLQLIRPGVRVLNPYHGKPGATIEKWYDETNAAERLGVPTHQVCDYLALVGDQADNIPGVKGIGDKGARELLARWGSLEAILAHVDEVVPPRTRNVLREHTADARLSRELVTVREDLPIALDLEALQVQPPDAAALRALYVELEFTTLARAVGDDGPAGEHRMPDRRHYHVVDTVAAMAALVASVRERGGVRFDTETEPKQAHRRSSRRCAPGSFRSRSPLRQGKLTTCRSGIGLRVHRAAWHLIPPLRSRVTNLPPLPIRECAARRPARDDSAVAKIAQNAKYDMLVLRGAGVRVRGLAFDTMLASYLLDPGRRSHGLDVLAFDLLHHTMISLRHRCAERARRRSRSPKSPSNRVRILVRGRRLHLPAVRALRATASGQGLESLLRDLELPLVDVLAEMEWTGVTIDLEWFDSLKTRFESERKATRAADLGGGRRGVQHQLQREASGDPLRTAWAAGEEAHGDRSEHRCVSAPGTRG